MHTRLKMVREALSEQNGKKISRQMVADNLGVSMSNIESYELNRRSPSNAFIKLFCSKYNVNEEWLRTGSGEMFKPKDRVEEIADITAELMMNETMKAKFIKAISNLSEEQLINLYEIGKQLIEDVENQKDQP